MVPVLFASPGLEQSSSFFQFVSDLGIMNNLLLSGLIGTKENFYYHFLQLLKVQIFKFRICIHCLKKAVVIHVLISIHTIMTLEFKELLFSPICTASICGRALEISGVPVLITAVHHQCCCIKCYPKKHPCFLFLFKYLLPT